MGNNAKVGDPKRWRMSAKMRAVAGIAAKVDAALAGGDPQAAPQCAITITRAASGKMLRWQKMHRQWPDPDCLPPVQCHDMG